MKQIFLGNFSSATLKNFLLWAYVLQYRLTYFIEVYSLKEHKAVFLKRQNLIFSIVAGSI